MNVAKNSDLKKESLPQKEEPNKEGLPQETLEETQHEIVIQGKAIHYTAHTGTLLIKDADKIKGSMFYVAYTKKPHEKLEDRPITFAFNGGPGSSAVWLHLGAFGPKKAALDKEGNPLPPPAQLVDNPHTLLDVSDLVFIDPISTGYSRAHPPEDAAKFHSVKKDMLAMAEFIRLFLTRYKRWCSPKFIAGESYGGTRAAYLAHHLEHELGIGLNGLMFISPALNFQTLLFGRESNQLAYACFLPTYAATAWYHGKLPHYRKKKLQQLLNDVEDFTEKEYLPYLMRGNRITAQEIKKIADKMANYTGLSAKFLEFSHMRIADNRFFKELLRDTFETIGRFDGRFKGRDRDAGGEYTEYDPSFAAIQSCYTTAWQHYVQTTLNYHSDQPYHILADVYKTWVWLEEKEQARYIDFSDEIRQTMTYNPFLNVYIGHGLYDLATPYYSSQYTAQHIGLDDFYQKRIVCKNYPAGHMMYIHENSHKQFSTDLKEFIKNSILTKQKQHL